jgi:hypothetical protein
VTGVAPSTWEAFQERVARLYEQNAPQEEIPRRIEHYPLLSSLLADKTGLNHDASKIRCVCEIHGIYRDAVINNISTTAR